jgi:hypothetical protein
MLASSSKWFSRNGFSGKEECGAKRCGDRNGSVQNS